MDRTRILFWTVIEPEHLKARAFCRKLMRNRDDGDDLYQDGLVRALTRFDELKDITAFRPWLYRILINTYKNRCRNSWWRRLVPITTEIEESMGGKNPTVLHGAKRRLEIAFKALTPDDKTLVTLFELQGWKVAELAEMTGKTENNIKVRLSRARQKMRDMLVKYLEISNQQGSPETISGEDEICVVTKPNKDC